jgi:hypothetical protein
MADQNPHSIDEVLDESINSLKSIQIGMSAAARTQLARRCVQEASSSHAGLLGWLRGTFAIPVPQAAMATAFGLLVLFGITAVMLSERSAVQTVNVERESQVQLVSLRPDASGHVTLEWRDGSQRTYRILKSNNPRDFSKAASFRVRGNRWTDPSPEGSGITYYKVE